VEHNPESNIILIKQKKVEHPNVSHYILYITFLVQKSNHYSLILYSAKHFICLKGKKDRSFPTTALLNLKFFDQLNALHISQMFESFNKISISCTVKSLYREQHWDSKKCPLFKSDRYSEVDCKKYVYSLTC
jgi:hypothetical protein